MKNTIKILHGIFKNHPGHLLHPLTMCLFTLLYTTQVIKHSLVRQDLNTLQTTVIIHS